MDSWEAQIFVKNIKNYNAVWSMSYLNHNKSKNKTNVNKELEKLCRTLSKTEIKHYAGRRVEYEYKSRIGTSYEMDMNKYDAKVNQLAGRQLHVAFKPRNDKKFRHFSERARYFCIFHPILEAMLTDHQELKRFLFGEEDFTFCPLFVEGLQNLSINHTQLVTRNEKRSEIENVCLWQNLTNMFNYALSAGSESLPIPDPLTM